MTAEGSEPDLAAAVPAGRRSPWGQRPVAAGTSLMVGLVMCAGLPPWGWWPLTIIGMAAWMRLVGDRPWRSRLLRSWGVGLGWFVPSLLWMVTFTPPGYVLASVVFGGMYGIVGALAPAGSGRRVAIPAGLVIAEWIRFHAPFGGVPLSMTSLTQADAPLAPVARLGGPLLLTLVIGLAAAALDAGVDLARSNPERRRWSFTAPSVASIRAWSAPPAYLVATIVFALIGAIAPAGAVVGTRRVAIVQGGGPQGTVALNTDAAEVFDRHLEASRTIPPGSVDLVLWPENVVNVDGRLEDHPWDGILQDEADRIEAPLAIGAVDDVDDRHFANYQVVYQPGADGSSGGSRYDKERRVPFGEYVPLRPLVEPFGGDLLPSRDQVPGAGRAVLDIDPDTADGFRAAVAISWEIFFPRRVREGVGEGGQVVLNPTNGASYWLTEVQTQQVANSRLRAIESGRWVLQAAPTGFSAVVDSAGDVRQRTAVSERRVLIARIELRDGLTPAQRVGPLAAGLASSAPLLWTRRRRFHRAWLRG